MRRPCISMAIVAATAACGAPPDRSYRGVDVYYSALAEPQPNLEEAIDLAWDVFASQDRNRVEELMQFSLVVVGPEEAAGALEPGTVTVQEVRCPTGELWPLWRTDFFHGLAEHHVPRMLTGDLNLAHATKWRGLTAHLDHTARVQFGATDLPPD